MGLRGKLAIIFLPLLLFAIVAVSVLEIERTLRVMVRNLDDSGTLVVNETFEQIRTALSQNGRRGEDPVAILRANAPLNAFLGSAQAFGKGVVYAQIDRPDGSIVAGSAPSPDQATTTVHPLDELRRSFDSWWPMSWLPTLWNSRTYEMSRAVLVGDRQLGVIRVGLSTGLIATEIRATVVSIVSIGAVAIALSTLAALMFGGFLLKPLMEITTGFEELASGNTEQMLKIGARDEFGTLADRFNQLSRRVRADRIQWENERGQYFNVFRSITDAVLLLDNSGKILFANAEAQGRLGLPSGGVADGKPLRLLLGRDHPLSRLVGTAYAVGNEVHDVALELDDDDGGVRLLVSIFALGNTPIPPGLLVILRDLDSVKQLENVVHNSGRLVRLSGLISGVAHQLRIPLNAMSLQLELLSNDCGEDARVRNRILAVRGEITRLDQAVDGLMRFLRPEQIKQERVRLAELLTDVGRRAARPGIQIEYHLEPGVMVELDKTLVEEALRNIAANAIEAMPNGGVLKFSSTMYGPESAEIRISDQGEGIPAETLDRIFELYYTTKPTGSGLGLPLALRAIDLHGGTIEIDSQDGSGTTVIVRLPGATQEFGLDLPITAARR